MQSSLVLATAAALFASAICVILPSNFRKCGRDDRQCILEAAQDGLTQLVRPFPSINLPNLDPLEILEMKIGAGKQAVAVEQNFRDCKVYGINKLVLKRFEFDYDRKVIDIDANFPELRLLCRYELNGKVLLLPIVGEGPSTIVLKDTHILVAIPYEETRSKDKTRWVPMSVQLALDPQLVTFDFENLFNGDKKLGDNINMVLNDNWKEVFEDVKEGYEKTIGFIVKDLLTRFFSKISVEEVFS